MRGLERIFEVSRHTVAEWIKDMVRKLPNLKDTLVPAEPGDVLELDEAWSLCSKRLKNGGFGQQCAVEPVKSWLV